MGEYQKLSLYPDVKQLLLATFLLSGCSWIDAATADRPSERQSDAIGDIFASAGAFAIVVTDPEGADLGDLADMHAIDAYRVALDPDELACTAGHADVPARQIRVGGILEEYGKGAVGDPNTDAPHIRGKDHLHEAAAKGLIRTERQRSSAGAPRDRVRRLTRLGPAALPLARALSTPFTRRHPSGRAA